MVLARVRYGKALWELGLTQRELADRLGVTRAHVSHLVGGQRQPSRTLDLLLGYVLEEHRRAKREGGSGG